MRQDKTRQDKTSQDKTTQDETSRDKPRRDKTSRNNLREVEMGRVETKRDEAGMRKFYLSEFGQSVVFRNATWFVDIRTVGPGKKSFEKVLRIEIYLIIC